MTFPTAPSAENDSTITFVNSSIDIDVLANDTDPNGGMSLFSVSDPVHGVATINPDDTVKYIPDAGYEGSDLFEYVVTDGTDESEIVLNGSSVVEEDRFSVSLDVWGDQIAISASTGDDGSVYQGGLVYVYERNGITWTEQQIISANDPTYNAQFGKDVDIDDDVMVVGAYKHNPGSGKTGAVYVYRLESGTWGSEVKLVASDGQDLDNFGRYLGVSGDIIAVGAWSNDANGIDSGAVYVFEWDGSNWIETAKLTASDAEAGDEFGRSVDIEGDVIVVGAKEDDHSGLNHAGSVYVFKKTVGSWSQEQKIIANDASEAAEFGNAVAINGNVLGIGAFRDDDMGSASGSVSLYMWNGSSWIFDTKILPNDGNAGDRFGSEIDIDNDLMVISSKLADDQGVDSGAFYLFQRNGDEWFQFKKFLSSDGVAGDNFGDRVSIHNNTIVAGAKFKNNDSGAAYIYPIGTDTAVVNIDVNVNTGPNNPPVLAAIGDLMVAEGDSSTVLLYASDIDGNSISFDIPAIPPFAQLTDNGDGTASLQMDPGFSDAGTLSVTVTVTDNGFPALTDDETLSIVVSDTNQPPVLTLIGDQAVPENGSKSIALSATDPDADNLSFSATGLPSFIVINDNGDNTGSIEVNAQNSGDNGVYTITVIVEDDGTPLLDAEETFDVYVGSTNQTPVLNSIGNPSIEEGETLNVPLAATDANGDNLSFSSTSLPPFAQLFDNGDGTATLALTPGLGDSGNYPLTIEVSDDGVPSLADDEMITISVSPVSGGGSVQGGLASIPSVVDLTSEGTADWVHFGLAFGEWLTRKSGVTPLISDYTPVGVAAVSSYVSTKIGYSWSDGTPSASVTNTKTGLRVYGVGEGFQLTVPADQASREVTFYLGAKKAKGRLEASLSDGSAVPYIVEIDQPNGKVTRAVTITYQAAFDNQTLVVTYTMDTAYVPSESNISIEAATISGGASSTNNAPDLNAIGDQSLADDATLNIPLSATDADADGLSFSAIGLPTFMSLTDNGDGTGNLLVSPSVGDAGAYPLTITVTDNGTPVLSDDEALTVFVNTSNGTGVLQGSSELAPSNVNLTSEGTADWAHFGLEAGEWFTQKDISTPLISNYTVLGGASVKSYSATKSSYSWSDGSPTVSASNTKTGLRVYEIGEGFSVSLPADLDSRTVTFYVGVKEAIGRFEATLSDGSATPYIQLIDKPSGKLTQAITLNYEADTSGQTLTVNFTMDNSYSAGSSVSLESVTVSGSAPSNNAPTLGEIGSQSLSDDGNLSVPLSATDVNGDNLSFTATGLPSFAWIVDNGDGTGSLEIYPSTGDAGFYPITIVVMDDGVPVLTDEEVVTISVSSTTGMGDVQGSISVAPSLVNLSEPQNADWAHYGLAFGEWFTHKSGVTSQISDYIPIGGAAVSGYKDTKTDYAWSDGEPTVSNSRTDTGLRVFGVGEGFQVSVPADLTTRRATFYVGVKKAKGRFEAMLSDGSAVPYVEMIDIPGGKSTRAVTVTYKATLDGQSLIVTYTMESTYDGSGSVSLESVTTATP